MEAIKQHITVNPLAINVWRRLKIKYPNALVWVRMEEHYYTFSRDAIAVHSICEVELYPCFQEHWHCAITCESAEAVIKKMIRAGFQVALCDELQ
jgi:DNA mismatch repair ATPase MutS